VRLRVARGGGGGLPLLFRRLWNRAGRRAAPVTEADVRAAARAVAGRPLDAFFDRYVHGTAEVPLPAILRRAGLDVTLAAPWSADGGEADPVKRGRARAWSGAVVAGQTASGERAIVKNVLPGSPAAAAGLTFNDEIVAVAGDRVNAANFARRLADHRPGARVAITYFRRDLLRETTLTVAASPDRRLQVRPAKPAAPRTVLHRWLRE
jgi:predicted metalloprotease with PDZ domain